MALIQHIVKLEGLKPEATTKKDLISLYVNQLAENIETQLKRDAEYRTPIVTHSRPSESINVSASDIHDSIVISMGEDSPRDRAVEYGRSPGAKPPPIKDIMEWASVVLGTWPDKIESTAFALANYISEYGTPGKYVLTRTLEDNLSWVNNEMNHTVKQINESIDKEQQDGDNKN